MNISCREFLERKQKQKKYHFNNVFDQQMLDSCLFSQLITKDETGITIFLHCDIEL